MRKVDRNKEYFYAVNTNTKTCVEFYCSKEDFYSYVNAFEIAKYYDHFPYAECGYEDPYNFIHEWTVYNSDTKLISVFVGERADGSPILLMGDC
jgi:hypothetical protein